MGQILPLCRKPQPTLWLPEPLTTVANVKSDSADPDAADNTASMEVRVEDFVITPDATSLTMTRGGSAKETLIFGAQGGFTGNLDLKCAVGGAATMPSCGISPSLVPADGMATLTVSAATLTAGLAPESHEAAVLSSLWLPFAVFGIVFARHARGKRRGRWLLLALLVLSTAVHVACGGGGTQPIHAPQQFTVTVTGTNSSTALETRLRSTLPCNRSVTLRATCSSILVLAITSTSSFAPYPGYSVRSRHLAKP